MKNKIYNMVKNFFIGENIKKNKIYLLFKILFSIVFSIVLILDDMIVFSGLFENVTKNYFLEFNNKYILNFFIYCILTYFMISIIEIFINYINKKRTNKEDKKREKKHYFFMIIWGFLLLCWSPFILSFFPGGIYSDTTNTLAQAIGVQELSNSNPLIYELFFKICIIITGNSLQHGVELFSIFQTLLMSFMCAYFVYFLYKRNINYKYLIITTIFFGFFKLIPLYAISLWKDTMFSIFLYFYIISIAEIILEETKIEKIKSLIINSILMILTALFRNNGYYAVFAMTIILIIYFLIKKVDCKKFILSSIITLMIIIIIKGPIYSYIAKNDNTAANTAVLAQQIYYVVATDGNITDEQKEFISKLYPLEKIKTDYAPCIIDVINWNEDFNEEFLKENKKEFFKIWLQIFFKNPGSYVKAYLFNTLGYWDPQKETGTAYTNPDMWPSVTEVKQYDIIEKVFKGKSIKDKLYIKNSIETATFLYLNLLGVLFTVYNKKYKNILIFLPAFFVWGTVMIAAPIAFSLRYVYILVLMLPISFILPFL